MREKLIALLEPAVATLGYELVELEFRAHGRGGLVRVYIDAEQGVTLDDCEKVSDYVNGILDVEDLVTGEYNLEVSSPGLDRPLRTLRHYADFVGEQVKVQLAVPLDGRRHFTGKLLKVENEKILVDVDGQEFLLPLENIEKARLAR
ncbi:MAG: ribosome maturation factor RimP [Gammaproteobacteria bacterium]